MNAYKIVCQRAGRLESFNPLPDGILVQYVPGKFIQPAAGRLFLFRDFDQACNFLYAFDNGNIAQVWECEARNARPFRRQALLSLRQMEEQGLSVLTAYWKRRTPGLAQVVMDGFYTASAVKLIKQQDV